MRLNQAIVLVVLGLVLVYVSWTVWRPVWGDWAMATRGVTVLATVTEVAPVLGRNDPIQRVSIIVPRTDGTSFQGRVRGWPGHSFAEGEQISVRYDPTGRLLPRLVDRWVWKAAAASLVAHVVTFLLASGMTLVGIGLIVRVAIDVRF